MLGLSLIDNMFHTNNEETPTPKDTIPKPGTIIAARHNGTKRFVDGAVYDYRFDEWRVLCTNMDGDFGSSIPLDMLHLHWQEVGHETPK